MPSASVEPAPLNDNATNVCADWSAPAFSDRRRRFVIVAVAVSVTRPRPCCRSPSGSRCNIQRTYDCDAETPVAALPSPKLHAYEAIVPDRSRVERGTAEDTHVNVGADWSAPALASGAWTATGADRRIAVSVAVAPLLSVTVNVTVNDARGRVRVRSPTPLPEVPSPKLHA